MFKSKLFISLLLTMLILSVFSVVAGASTLDKIQSRGKIVIAVNAGAPPFTFRDSDGKLTGMCIDLDKLLAKKMGVEVEFVDMDWAGLIPALLSKRVDMIGDRMSNTLERAKSVAYTDSYLQTGTMAYTKVDSSFKNIKDILGKNVKVGVLLGSVQESVAEDNLPEANIVPLNGNADIKQALMANRVDVALDDEIIADLQVKTAPKKLRVLPGFLVVDTYSYTVRQEDNGLRLWLNLFFERSKRSGKFAEIYKKWLGKEWNPVPQKQL